MANPKKEEYHVVTEVGTFGSLNIEDPTTKKIKSKKELDDLIRESIESNHVNLTNK